MQAATVPRPLLRTSHCAPAAPAHCTPHSAARTGALRRPAPHQQLTHTHRIRALVSSPAAHATARAADTAPSLPPTWQQHKLCIKTRPAALSRPRSSNAGALIAHPTHRIPSSSAASQDQSMTQPHTTPPATQGQPHCVPQRKAMSAPEPALPGRFAADMPTPCVSVRRALIAPRHLDQTCNQDSRRCTFTAPLSPSHI